RADEPVRLRESQKPVALYLKSLTLTESFDWSLFGKATNELYLVAVAWDLSGRMPHVFPPTDQGLQKGVDPALAGGVYLAKEGDRIVFVGDGIQLWPLSKFVGGLYVRVLVMESDSNARKAGERLAQVREAIEKHALVSALAGLAAGPTAAAVAAVGAAAVKLTGVIADILQKDGDDVVALFDGTYGAEGALQSREESYAQQGAAIQLALAAGDVPDALVRAPMRAPGAPAAAPRAREAPAFGTAQVRDMVAVGAVGQTTARL
ncbi:MAG: hypothetical protein HY906_02520, partial [Deltaproteobacteria bacterium]|nr:hypothetical protein [Deltaproteobacteria bacterium]